MVYTSRPFVVLLVPLLFLVEWSNGITWTKGDCRIAWTFQVIMYQHAVKSLCGRNPSKWLKVAVHAVRINDTHPHHSIEALIRLCAGADEQSFACL